LDDPEFALDDHLHRVLLRPPGGITELEQFAAHVISRPLDPARPPWGMHVVEGLEGGMVGAVTKMHHAAVDGISGAELTATLLISSPSRSRSRRPTRHGARLRRRHASRWRPEHFTS